MSEAQYIPDPITEIPLRSISFESIVAGLRAEVTVHQKFGNTLNQHIEAIYVFPLDDEASILGFDIRIGQKTIKSNLKEKARAKIEYENARDAGHHAAIVEQERPNIFTVSVAGIEPGEEIEATTRYIAPVPWQNNGGRLTFPTVVAPRFIPGKPKTESSGHGWSPDTDKVPDASKITPHISAEVPYRVSLNLTLAPGFACEISSPSHPEDILKETYKKDAQCNIGLFNIKPDKDIVIVYKTFSEQPNVAVFQTIFTAPDKTKEYFVLAQVTAPMSETSKRQRNVVFLLDDSGSMRGKKMDGLKKIVNKILQSLSSDESSQPTNVGVIAFNYAPKTLMTLSAISDEHYTAIDSLSAVGGTMMGQATTVAMGMFKKNEFDPETSECCIVAISDGQTEDNDFQAVSGVRIHTIGIDSAINNETLKSFARKTGGHSEFVLPGENFSGVATAMVGLTTGPIVRDLNVKELTKDASVFGLSDLFNGRPVTIAIRSKKTLEEITISGQNTNGTVFNEKIKIPLYQDTPLATYVWAKNAMRETTDTKKLTAISLKYGLLGSTTAFVAISEKPNPTGKPVTVEVPVLLPETWEYDAVFGASSSLLTYSSGGGSVRRCAFLGGSSMLFRGAVPTLDSKSGLLSHPDEHLNSLCEEVADLGSVEEPSADSGSAVSNVPNPLLELAEEMLQLHQSGKSTEVKSILIQQFEFITAENYLPWSELDKARLYEILAELFASKQYGITIPAAITNKPTDVDAYHCWCRAKTFLKEKIS